jgi:hypothetical protein
MNPKYYRVKKRSVVSKLSLMAMLAGSLVVAQMANVTDTFIHAAYAEEDGGGGPSGKGKGPNPDAGGGHGGSGGSGEPGNVPGGAGSGQGGPGTDSDAKGPRFGGGENTEKPGGDQGGRPTWAKEGIPETELGRLSVVRSPSHVIDRSVAEAISTFDEATMASFLNLSVTDAANLLKTSYDTVVRLDSPLQNIGLYRDLINNGTTALPGVTGATTLDLAAILFGSAADKTIPITTDTVSAVNTILGITMSDADVATVAEGAEAIRQAILEGHG